MKRIRIGLRLHIFLAFLIVFLFSFAVVIVSFNIFVQNYINNDAKDKLNQSIQLARNLAEVKKNNLVFSTYDNDTEIIENTIIRALSGSSDVRIALISSDNRVLYPSASEFISGKNTPLTILQEMNDQKINLDVSSVHNLHIENASFYVSSVPIVVNPIGGIPSDIMYLLLYLDASPYLLFLQSINQILLAILLFTLILTLLTSLLVSNGIIRSMQKLTVFASKIGKGIFERQTFHFFDKEIDNLAADMNVMADKLEQTDKEQKTFFQNASHELRTPMMSIQGYAEGIRYNVFDDPKKAADVIISESKRLSGMVENLLSISRLDTAAAGRLHIPKNTIDLNELIASVSDKVRGAALLVDKSISLRISDNEIYIMGNENDLFRAFENMISNAIRYASSVIQISITQKSKDTVDVQIMDDGMGIAEDLMPRIFDRFSRGDDGKHGIGLALVRSIITDHQGYVSASNRNDGHTGAIFTVTLPVSRSEDRTM